MLVNEAVWFKEHIRQMDSRLLFPMANIGSSTERFRKIEQPWIEQCIFNPIREGNHKVTHVDIKNVQGVDIVGDLSDPDFILKLSKMGFKSVLCSNFLEHVRDRARIAGALLSIVDSGGYILISCPYEHPYHPDPIDTMFRPTVKELAGLFPNSRIVAGGIITDHSYFFYITMSLPIFFRAIARLFIPFYKPVNWLISIMQLPWLFRNYKTTCVVLQKS